MAIGATCGDINIIQLRTCPFWIIDHKSGQVLLSYLFPFIEQHQLAMINLGSKPLISETLNL